jgi:hypothetical protein
VIVTFWPVRWSANTTAVGLTNASQRPSGDIAGSVSGTANLVNVSAPGARK